MSFILKNNPTIINIKLTNVGRQLLSQGKLTITKWAVGDSEIDYTFYNKISFDPFMANILRPKDQNPNFTSFILQNSTDVTTNFTLLPTVVSNTNIITNTATNRGFFDVTGTTKKILTNAFTVRQADMQVFINTLTGGTTLKIRKSPSYISNIYEPVVGDYLLVKWANPLITGGTVNPNVDKAIPFLWYKIESKVSGNLNSDNLVVRVDKPLPNFNGQGGSTASGLFCYPNSNNRLVSGDSIQTYYSAPFVTDFIDDSVIAFLENCICPVRDVPVWNMAIVFTDEVAGVKLTDRNYSQYYTNGFGGFVQYIEKISPIVKNIGIIHFTNASPSNHYAEGFFQKTPILDLPTIMWHFETGNTIGLQLKPIGVEQQITGLSVIYYDLADKYGNVVGKVFNDLKIFVIEDQDLLFAMTYKSNRNWTLPKPAVGLNLQLAACAACLLNTPTAAYIPETSTGANDAIVTVTATGGQGTLLYSMDGVHYQTSNIFLGVSPGVKTITVVDPVMIGCTGSTTITILP